MTFRIDYLPAMTNRRHGKHWSHYYRERSKVYALCLAACPKEWRGVMLEKAHITITRGSTRQPDYDGLVSGGKAVVDSLIGLEILVDDDPGRVTREYRWEKAPRGKGYVEVTVEAREA